MQIWAQDTLRKLNVQAKICTPPGGKAIAKIRGFMHNTCNVLCIKCIVHKAVFSQSPDLRVACKHAHVHDMCICACIVPSVSQTSVYSDFTTDECPHPHFTFFPLAAWRRRLRLAFIHRYGILIHSRCCVHPIWAALLETVLARLPPLPPCYVSQSRVTQRRL